MDIFKRTCRFFKWLFGKSSELKDLRWRDFLLAELVLKIQNNNLGTKFIVVPLFSIKQLHSIDRESALQKVEQRKKVFEQHKEQFVGGKTIRNSFLETAMPSVTPIKMVRMDEGKYVAFEGNGRLAALQQVFSQDEDVLVEAELYKMGDDPGFRNMVRRVMKANNI